MISVLGCGKPLSTEAMRRQVLAADPGFDKPLEKRDQLADRINVLRQELALKQAQVDGKIAQLRKELRETKTQALQKIEETRQGLSPERERVELALAMAGEELKAKRAQRASVGSQIAQLKKAAQGASGLGEQERVRQEAKVAEMLKDAKRLDDEMTSLKEHVRLLKIKLLLIKL